MAAAARLAITALLAAAAAAGADILAVVEVVEGLRSVIQVPGDLAMLHLVHSLAEPMQLLEIIQILLAMVLAMAALSARMVPMDLLASHGRKVDHSLIQSQRIRYIPSVVEKEDHEKIYFLHRRYCFFFLIQHAQHGFVFHDKPNSNNARGQRLVLRRFQLLRGYLWRTGNVCARLFPQRAVLAFRF
jgi:hypothetical protein